MAFGLPNVDQLEKMFDEDFDRLIAKLDELLVEVKGMRGDLQARGEPQGQKKQ
jgi:hypothetical protein